MHKKNSKRQQANQAILARLAILIQKYPDWRFHQILMNSGISNGTDQFYEESIETLSNMNMTL